METVYRGYLMSDDKSRINLDALSEFLGKSYWASHRSLDTIKRTIESSLCYGVYDGERLIGFARVITDGVTFYYLCDVYVDEEYRGEGIGKKLVEWIVQAPHFQTMSGMLRTRDAHGLYEQFGFTTDADNTMRRAAQIL
ncbi:Acetyltransferase (GNAT) domain-containing protein [Paenibacillaceae bacterium GAS479]|nr:Acetyltransferase (GNAT) domain-containing protein [Paenibacillaceae bacterium GAS479]